MGTLRVAHKKRRGISKVLLPIFHTGRQRFDSLTLLGTIGEVIHSSGRLASRTAGSH